jgi:uncharacterized protein (TIGR02145 family)
MNKSKSVSVLILIFYATFTVAQSVPSSKKSSAIDKGLKSIKVGSETWTSQNLNVSFFRNGDAILQARSIDEWKKALDEGRPAWCYYEFQEPNGLIYGKFYNWYAVHDARGLAPKGWHIPKIEEWDTLLNFIGSNQVWDKMVDTSGWMKGMSKTSNETGFSVLGGGLCGESSFGGIGMETAFWCASKDPSSIQNSSNLLTIHFGTSWAPSIGKVFGEERGGMYVRCVKDKQ